MPVKPIIPEPISKNIELAQARIENNINVKMSVAKVQTQDWLTAIEGKDKFYAIWVDTDMSMQYKSQKDQFITSALKDLKDPTMHASDEKLKSLSLVNKNTIEFKINLNKNISKLEKEIIFDVKHFLRGDINEYYLRSTMSRVIYKTRENIIPNNNEKTFSKGDVLIINSLDKNYQKELVVILKDDFKGFDKRANLIGKIDIEEHNLLMMVQPWFKFNFKEI
ncbi:DUF871 domain-containing protein [Spiroplasma endosymbiont of Anurida maritima]|uniref:phospho-sugar glycosidase domain-containing protein n=1 Tax=Spiroplasma endosymbiont of Anurida maritima TaxID=2967972 RepID=UPI0036D41C31